MKIENHYGFPCDIEWAFEKGGFYIVQSRPITTLSERISDTVGDGKGEDKQEKFISFKIPVYRYFFANKYLSHVKFKGIYLWKEWYDEITPQGMANIYISERTFLQPGKILLNLLKNENKDLMQELYELSNELLRSAEYLMVLNYKDQKKGKVSNLKEFIPKFYKIFNKALAFGYALDAGIDVFVKENKNYADGILHYHDSFLATEEYELKQIFSRKNVSLDKSLEEHLYRWSWIKTDYRGENHLTKKDLFERKDETINTKYSEPKPWPKKFKKPKNLNEWISLLVSVRDIRKKVALISTVLLDRYLKKSCEKLGLDYYKARFLTIEEFEKEKHLKNIHDYTEGRYEHISPNGIKIFSQDEWEKLPFITKNNLENNNLTGITATKGFVKGKVKIILSSDDFPKFKKGEIIVASMTRPEFMPVIKMATAILTEQGGITCHAAIISRELKIPCIIGIKNLTDILKDGDIVEVDADKGIVRIIK